MATQDPVRFCCGKKLPLLQVKKETVNKGRSFFRCASCNTFVWAQGPTTVAQQSSSPGRAATQSANWKKSTEPNPQTQFNQQFRNQDKGLVDIYFEIKDEKHLIVRGYHEKLVPYWRSLPYAVYNAGARGWVIPISQYEDCINKIGQLKDIKPNIKKFPANVVKLFSTLFPSEQQKIEVAQAIKEKLGDLWGLLLKFQKEGVIQAVLRGGRILLGDEMGLGKTVQALSVCSYYSEWPVLVICPSSLRQTWASEIKKWLNMSDSKVQVIFHGSDNLRIPLPHFVIVSYDLCSKLSEKFQDKFLMIIADEAHYLKNKDSKRSKTAIALIKEAKRALLLTGTPALSRPKELFAPLNALDSRTFPMFSQFGIRYCDAKPHYYRGMDYDGSSNLSELHWMLERTVLIRRLKKDVELELPPKTRQIVKFEIDKTYIREIAKLRKQQKQLQAELGIDEGNKSMTMKLKKLLNEMYELTAHAKINGVKEYISDIYSSTTQKFLVFAHHQVMVNAISDHLANKLEAKFIRIDGKTPAISREELCDQFQDDENTRVAVLSLTAANVGLTLHSADCVLFAELYWNPSNLLQVAEDRAHRIGRKDNVDVKYILADGTADDVLWKLVQKKLRIVGQMLDNGSDKVTMEEGTTFGRDDQTRLWDWLGNPGTDNPIDDMVEFNKESDTPRMVEFNQEGNKICNPEDDEVLELDLDSGIMDDATLGPLEKTESLSGEKEDIAIIDFTQGAELEIKNSPFDFCVQSSEKRGVKRKNSTIPSPKKRVLSEFERPYPKFSSIQNYETRDLTDPEVVQISKDQNEELRIQLSNITDSYWDDEEPGEWETLIKKFKEHPINPSEFHSRLFQGRNI
ncbi:hypothetical protein G9A89_023317 [Geosiphon pyriformis]|nr:hypothetical protein G9A89_023317 [Geosiphon pyriformis]